MGNISSSERRDAMNRVHINDNNVRMPPHSKNASRQEYLDESMKSIWEGNRRNINDDGPGAFSSYTKAAIYYKKANDKKN